MCLYNIAMYFTSKMLLYSAHSLAATLSRSGFGAKSLQNNLLTCQDIYSKNASSNAI